MDVLQPSINWEVNSLSEEWDRFEEHAKLMFAGPLSGKTEKVQCAYLLIWAGAKGREIFNTFNVAPEELHKIEPYLAKFKAYASPQKNTVFAQIPVPEARPKRHRDCGKIHHRSKDTSETMLLLRPR